MPDSIVTISLSADAGAIHLWHIVFGAAAAAVFLYLALRFALTK